MNYNIQVEIIKLYFFDMNIQVNQLVITEFGYGIVTNIAPIVIPDSKRSLGSL